MCRSYGHSERPAWLSVLALSVGPPNIFVFASLSVEWGEVQNVLHWVLMRVR